MVAIPSRSCRSGLSIAILALAAVFAGTAHAYTPEQQQACSGDAMRLCGSELPNIDRITACMIARRSLLSPGCRVYFRSPAPGAHERQVRRAPLAHRRGTVKAKKVRKPAGPR
jgi:hypothetical protein